MKSSSQNKRYFFVDESGDTTFYDRYGTLIVGQEGCSKILILGFIRTEEPHIIRQKLTELRQEIAQDKYLTAVPSLQKTLRSFHAKDDCPEVREKVFKLIETLDFKAEFVVARKIESLFRKRHHSNPGLFYDDLVMHLFKNQLHLAHENIIYFAKRGSKDRQDPLAHVIAKSINIFEQKYKTQNHSVHKIFRQLPKVEPCLQVIDYMNWAVHRAFVRGEQRYLDFVHSKVSLICDIYDVPNYGKNFYTKKNIFSITKISPL